MNKFKQVSIDDHQRSVQYGPMSEGTMHSEVQYIMDNGHVGPFPPFGQND